MNSRALMAAAALLVIFLQPSFGISRIPLKVTHTVTYTIKVHWSGEYYPDRTTLRLEIHDIPIQTEYQRVTADLKDGRLENIDGRPVWVIEKYMREVPYTIITFTGTFEVTVDVSDMPSVPSIPVEPTSGMERYLQPDEYVTLSPSVVSLARQLAAEEENDLSSIITRFVGWIRENIRYDIAIGQDVRLKDYQVLQTRAGVCDEFAILFIAFCRSVGIPARYVQGYSVDNENLYQRLETGHAWAEVWIPDRGWLPVDPTWMELGNAKKFITGGEGINYFYSGAPPGSRITKVEYYVTPVGWRVSGELGYSIVLSGNRTENGWMVSIANTSTIPVLDNLVVKRYIEETEKYEDLPGWPKLLFLNPGENLTFNVGKFDYGWAYSRLGGSINLWKPPEISIPFVSPEYMPILAFLIVVFVISLLLISIKRRR